MFSLHSGFHRMCIKHIKSLYLIYLFVYERHDECLIPLRINYLVKGLDFGVPVVLEEKGRAALGF